jgi:hypothetical protein
MSSVASPAAPAKTTAPRLPVSTVEVCAEHGQLGLQSFQFLDHLLFSVLKRWLPQGDKGADGG